MSYLGKQRATKKKFKWPKDEVIHSSSGEGSFNIHRKLFVPESEMRAPNRSRSVNLVKPASAKQEKSNTKNISVKA